MYFTRGMWMNAFNLVNKNSLVASEVEYQKLNKMMVAGDVSLYAHHFMGEDSFTISVEYTDKDKSSTSARINGKDLNFVINEAYTWSTQRGFIKE
jgi:hypothetical protein